MAEPKSGWVDATSGGLGPIPTEPFYTENDKKYWKVVLQNGGEAIQAADDYDEAVYKVNQRAVLDFGGDTGATAIQVPENSRYRKVPLPGDTGLADFMLPSEGMTDEERKQERLKYAEYAERSGAIPQRKIDTGIPSNLDIAQMDRMSPERREPEDARTLEATPAQLANTAEAVGSTGSYVAGLAAGGTVGAPTGPGALPIAVASGVAAQTAFETKIMPKVRSALDLPASEDTLSDRLMLNIVTSTPDLLIPGSGNLARGGVRSYIRSGANSDRMARNSAKLKKYNVTPYASVEKGTQGNILESAEDVLFTTFLGRGPLVDRSRQNLDNFTKFFEENITKADEMLDIEATGARLLEDVAGTRAYGERVRRGGSFDDFATVQMKRRNEILDTIPPRTGTGIDESYKELARIGELEDIFHGYKSADLDALISRYKYSQRTGNDMSIQDLVDLKRYVSDRMENITGMGTVTPLNAADVQKFSSALDEDIVRGMAVYDKNNGTNIASDYVQIKKDMTERMVDYEQNLKGVFKKNPSKAYGEIYSAFRLGDATKLKSMLAHTGNDTKEMVATKTLQSMGYRDGVFDPKKFASQWGKLSDKRAAKEVMFGYDENLLSELDELAGNFDAILASTRFADKKAGILSRTVPGIAAGGAVGGAAYFGSEENRMAKAAGLGLLTMLAPGKLSKLLSDPQYVGALNDYFEPGKLSMGISLVAKLTEVASGFDDLSKQAAHLDLLSIIDSYANDGKEQKPKMVKSGGN